jgi:type I restriction enzyme R subunit
LNQFADVLYPGKYKSDFALQVTSSIPDAQQFTINFSDKNNNLNGRTEFLDGYKSSKTRVCVTVGMMTTGYDCQDILNLCMMRPIFSPTDFVQIKGRGTRKYLFTHKLKDGHESEVHQSAKNKFKLFDFFANCEYFEKKFNYDEVLKLPVKSVYTGGGDGSGVVAEEFKNYDPDPLKTLTEKAIGLEGMKIDRKLFEKFEETVKEDMFIQ